MPDEFSKRRNTFIAAMIAIAGAIAILLYLGGCNPYAVAWRTMDGVIKARDLTAQQLAGVAKQKNLECVAAHGVKTPAYTACIKPTRDILEHWQKQARPAINSALQITAASVQIAERVKDSKIDWLAILRPAACALWRCVKSWGHYLPDKGQTALLAINPFGEMLCK